MKIEIKKEEDLKYIGNLKDSVFVYDKSLFASGSFKKYLSFLRNHFELDEVILSVTEEFSSINLSALDIIERKFSVDIKTLPVFIQRTDIFEVEKVEGVVDVDVINKKSKKLDKRL